MSLYRQFLEALKTGLGKLKIWDGTNTVGVTAAGELKVYDPTTADSVKGTRARFGTEFLPLTQAIGNSYFVDAARPDDTGDGTTWATAKKTINAAIGLCTANNNDYIFIKAGSYDENANPEGVLVDVDGINIIGQGKHTIVTNTHATATGVFTIRADNVRIESLSTDAGVPVRVGDATSTANRCILKDCWFKSTAIAVILWGDSNVLADCSLMGRHVSGVIHLYAAKNCLVIGNKLRTTAAGYRGIYLEGSSGLEVEGNFIVDNEIITYAPTTDYAIAINSATYVTQNTIACNRIAGLKTIIGPNRFIANQEISKLVAYATLQEELKEMYDRTVWAEKLVGTLTADGTEQTLVEETAERNLYGYLDMSNLATGDSITIRQYVIIKSGGSYIKVGEKTYSDAQAIPLLEFPESHAKYGQKITLEQVAGTYRTFDYNFFTR